MIKIVIKKYKFIVGIFLILCIVSVTVCIYIKKENIYILYNNEVFECKQIDKYEKNKYPLCYDGRMYLFEKIDKKPIILVDDLKKIKLTSKKDFFKYFNQSLMVPLTTERLGLSLCVKKRSIPIK